MKLKQITLAISTALTAVSAHAAESVKDVACDNPTGCVYHATNKFNTEANDNLVWQVNHDYRAWSEDSTAGGRQYIDAKDIRVTLKPQHYQNKPASHSGYVRSPSRPDHYERRSNSIISFSAHHRNGDARTKSELIIPKDTKITLEEDFQDSNAVYVHASNATIAKGVTITVNPSYAEKHNIDVSKFVEGDDTEAGNAIDIFAISYTDHQERAHVKSSADIVLNGKGSAGVNLYGEGSSADLSDHNITLNAKTNLGLDNGHNGGLVHAKRVNIVSGSPADEQMGLSGGNILFEDGKIDLSAQNLTVGLAVWNENHDITVNNSNIRARYAIGTLGHLKDDNPSEQTLHFNNSTVRGEKSLLVINPTEIQPDRFNHSDERPDFRGNLTLNARNSKLYGKTEFNRQTADAAKNRNITLNLTDGSEWTLNGNSELDHLNVAGSQVQFERGGEFKTLTVHGDLGGNGTFEMNTNLAKRQGDKLVVKGQVSGGHLLRVRDSEEEPDARYQSLTLVQSGGGNGTFALAGGHVDAGAFRYRLSKRGNDWALAYSEDVPKPPEKSHEAAKNSGYVLPNATLPAPSAPNQTRPSVPPAVSAPPQTASPQPPTLPAPRMLSRYAAQNLAHIQAAAHTVQQQNEALNQRLADLHSAGYLNGLWTEGENGSVQRYGRAASPHTRSPAVRETRHAYQIGYDYRFGAGYLGALAGQGRSRLHYRDGDYPDSTLKHNTFAAYGGAAVGDWFADAVWRHNRYKGIGAGSTQRFRTDTLTVQAGANLALNGHWYLSPQAGLTAGYLSGGRADKTMLLQTRAGVGVHGWLPLGYMVLKPSFGLHYLGDHRKTTMNFNGHRLAAPHAGGRVAVSAGAGVDFNIRHSVNVKLQGEYGRHLRRPYHIGIGYRYSW